MVGNWTQNSGQYRTCIRDLSPYARFDTDIPTMAVNGRPDGRADDREFQQLPQP
jgi:hypothetical protein